eukprot:1487_1
MSTEQLVPINQYSKLNSFLNTSFVLVHLLNQIPANHHLDPLAFVTTMAQQTEVLQTAPLATKPNAQPRAQQSKRIGNEYHHKTKMINNRYEPYVSGINLLKKRYNSILYKATTQQKLTLAFYPAYASVANAVSSAMIPHLYRRTGNRQTTHWIKIAFTNIALKPNKVWKYLDIKMDSTEELDLQVSFELLWQEFVDKYWDMLGCSLKIGDAKMGNFTYGDNNIITLNLPCEPTDHEFLLEAMTLCRKFNLWSVRARQNDDFSATKQAEYAAADSKNQSMDWWKPSPEELRTNNNKSMALNKAIEMPVLTEDAHNWYQACGGIQAKLITFDHTTISIKGLTAPTIVSKGTKMMACLQIRKALNITV